MISAAARHGFHRLLPGGSRAKTNNIRLKGDEKREHDANPDFSGLRRQSRALRAFTKKNDLTDELFGTVL